MSVGPVGAFLQGNAAVSPFPVDPSRTSSPPLPEGVGPDAPSLSPVGRVSQSAWRAGAPVAATDIAGAWYLTPRPSARGVDDVLLLLEGGLARRSLADSPLSLVLPDADPAAWPPGSPWALWRTGGNGAPELLDAGTGEWSAVDGRRIDTAPKPVGATRGTYERVDAQCWGTSTFVRTSVLVLDGAGRFASWTQSLSTYEGVLAALPGTRFGGWTRDAVDEGRYALLDDGLTIELTRSDGTIGRELFHADGGSVHLHGHPLQRRGDAPDVDGLLARMDDAGRRVHVGSRDWLAVVGEAGAEESKDDARRKRLALGTRHTAIDSSTFGA